MTQARTDTAAFVRGKLFMAGVDRGTPIGITCDVITVLAMDVPTDDLVKWRREFDHALWKVRPPSREEWGRLPGQEEQTARLAGMSVRPGQAAPGARAVPPPGAAGASRGTRGTRP